MHRFSDKKKQILEAAEQLFQKFGYSKTSLEDIAKEAALGKGTIYYYFNSKEDIFMDVVQLHSNRFYATLVKEIKMQTDFVSQFTTAISLPIKLVYRHTPTLIDAIKNLPSNYMQKLETFRDENKHKMLEILNKVISNGMKQHVITESIPIDKLISIIFDWFLLGDSNIIIKNPEEFIKKAEADYGLLVQLMLYGIIKRG